MTRRCLALILLGACSAPATPAPPERPNVVLIVGDDQGWTDFGFMGHPVIRTPHIDRLASESLAFPNGYVPTSLCRASLATILTGLYANQHKICCNDPPEGMDRSVMLPFLRGAPTIPRLLKTRGYRSLQTGKFWEGHYSNGGFTHGMTTKGRHGEEGLKIGRETMRPIYDFIESEPGAPFFLWYAPMMPHDPHTPPERILQKYAADGRNLKLAKYWAMCEWFDETVGELLGYLDRKGLRENTLVLFVIDNGWIQETGEVRTTRGWFAPKSKMSPYDGGVRTPLLVRWPGRVRPGVRKDLVSTIDVAPTLLEACGLPRTPDMKGMNLVEGGAPREAVFGEIYVHTAMDVQKPGRNVTHRWVRKGDWKLIASKERTELYDVARDPTEEREVSAEHPKAVRELTRLLDDWWKPW